MCSCSVQCRCLRSSGAMMEISVCSVVDGAIEITSRSTATATFVATFVIDEMGCSITLWLSIFSLSHFHHLKSNVGFCDTVISTKTRWRRCCCCCCLWHVVFRAMAWHGWRGKSIIIVRHRHSSFVHLGSNRLRFDWLSSIHTGDAQVLFYVVQLVAEIIELCLE